MKFSMGIAALVMAISVLLSRFMGLIRDKVISWQFGVGAEADVYFAAFVIPDFINYLLAGGYLSITLIPFLAKKFEEETQSEVISNTKEIGYRKDSWAFFGTVFSWAFIAITFLSLLAFIFAESLVGYVAPGFDANQKIRLAYFIRIIIFAQVFFLLGACFSAILYIRQEFLIPALMPLIYNGSILLLGVLMPYLGVAHGMEGFCYGVLFGAFFGAFLLPYIAVVKGGLEWNLGLKHKDFGKFLLLALPLMLGQSVVILDEQFIRIFGSLAESGSVSLLNYARRIMLVPVGVVAQAAALASFPFLAKLVAQNKEDEFNNSLINALNSSLVIIIPMSLYMILEANTILGLIFEGGVFDASHTEKGTPLLKIMLVAVPFWAIQQIIGRAFYARQNTIIPAVVGTISTLCVLPLYIYYVPKYGAFMVSIITTLSLIIYTLALVFVWDKRYRSSLPLECFKTFLRSVFISMPAIFFAWYIGVKTSPYILSFSPLAQQLLELAITGTVFSIIWLLFALQFMRNNVLLILAPFIRRFKAKRGN